MANYAYLSLWFRDFAIEKGLTHLEVLLSLFPVSAARPGFRLVVRSLGPGQSPSLEADLLATPADVRTAASEFPHDDTAYEVTACWDLWRPHGEADWEQAPSVVEFLLAGEQFDDARYREAGHLQINLGPETLYLGPPEREGIKPSPTPSGPGTTLRFARENVRRLHAFLRALEQQVPLSQHRLWSEGEPDFGPRTEQILSL